MNSSVLLDRARQQGCERLVLLGMLLAHRLFGVPLDFEVQQRSKSDPTACAMATELGQELVCERDVPGTLADAQAFRLRVRERFRDKLELMSRRLARRKSELLPDPLSIVVEKKLARQAWSQRANTWCHWAEEGRNRAEELDAPLLEAAQLARGQRVLDLASGPGVSTLSIARHVGEQGRVVAVDDVLPMLCAVKNRAAASGLESIAGCAADMEDLPFADASFDRLVCRFGIMFSARFERALAESFRILVSGGKATFAVWGPTEHNTFFDVAFQSLKTLRTDSGSATNSPLFRFASGNRLAQAMRQANFTRVLEHEVRLRKPIPDNPQFWRAQFEMTFATLLPSMTGTERGQLEQVVEAGFAARRRTEGSRLCTHVRVIVGTRS